MHHIRAFIHQRDLKVGDPLPGEAHFATELGVSRAVMREAFGALAALRLIDVANGRRARVGAIDGSVMGTSIQHAVSTAQVSLAEVWDVRRTLEFRTVELAARNRSADDARDIIAAAEAMAASSDDMDRMAVHDIHLHQAIARASGNLLFYQVIRSFEPLMTIAVPKAWETRITDEQRQQMLDCHRRIAEAIAAGDAEAAKEALDAHFASTIARLLGESDAVV